MEIAASERDFVGYGQEIPKVTWPGGAKVAVSLVINYEEGSEYSHGNGDARNELLGEVAYATDPQYRDLSVESSYEYGARAGIWRVLRLFEEYDLRCTFYASALAFEKNPEVARYARESGHDLVAHGWRWIEQWTLTRDEEAAHIRRAVESLTETFGRRPEGWCCRYGPSIHTRELLVEEGGFTFDSDAYNDDLPYFTRVNGVQHLVVPYSLTYNDMHASRTPTELADFWKRALDELWAEGDAGQPKMMSIGLHARVIGQAGRLSALREFLDHASSKGDVWFAGRTDIANWWLEHADSFPTSESRQG